MSSGKAPLQVLHLDHVVLRARDSKAMVAFYQEIIGLHVERSLAIGLVQLRGGSCLVDIVDADSKLGASGGPPPEQNSGGMNQDHFCLRVEPFEPDAIIAHLQAAGAKPSAVQQVYGAEGVGPSIYCEDPEGNRVELKGPAC